MKSESRSRKTLLNIFVAIFYSVITMALGFYSRKVFLDALGANVLGLNSTAVSLLGFLNLVDLGVGIAVAFCLYKPLANQDQQTIKEIVTVQKWLYRRIAYVIIACSVILCCFFPIIFDDMSLPLWYAYASFLVLLFSSLLGYFCNYKQILLSANQQGYIINNNTQGVKVTKTLIQIVTLSYFSNSSYCYVYWLIIEVVAAIVTSIVLQISIRKHFPWVKVIRGDIKYLIDKHRIIITKMKQLFVHRISAVILTNASPLIIFAYISLNYVTIYGNYMLLITSMLVFSNALTSSMGAGIGNLVAEGVPSKISSFYKEFTSVRYCFSGIMAICFFTLSSPFISIWFGAEYLMDQSVIILLTIFAFITITRTNEPFLVAYGLFDDIWASIAEASLNLGLSLLLGYFWGLEGILIGVIISLLLIINIWKPYYLYKRGFKLPALHYINYLLKTVGINTIVMVLFFFMLPYIYNQPLTILQWFIQAAILFATSTIVSIAIFQILSPDFRRFTNRMKALVLSKFF